jgi:thymidylate synthase (FAD)
MKIHLVTHTPKPEKAIAAAFLNMGIGVGFKSLDEITDAQAKDALDEIFKTHLTGPLEFASFNFYWEDMPIFLRAQLVRHRVGWSYAERSLRFFDANLQHPVENYDWDALPTASKKANGDSPLFDAPLKDVVQHEMTRQMELYSLLIKNGMDTQDARNIIGVWFPTALQTAVTYRALRDMLSNRLSSQAHPFWQKAAKEIKQLVTEISPLLGSGLVDVCQIQGRCVWNSKYDRDCDDCITRGRKVAHDHSWTRDTSFGENTQCDCGVLKPSHLLK